MNPRFAALLTALAVCVEAHATTALSELRYTPDITVNLNGTVVHPDEVARDTLSGAPTPSLLALPANLAAYYYAGSGVHWLVFDTTVALPGGGTATPQDIVSYDGTNYAVIFPGGPTGIPAGVAIDALSSTDGSDYLMSFDTTATVGSVTAGPADVVRRSGGSWSSYFTGAGVPAGANLDALAYLPNGHLLMSFDISGSVGGVSFGSGDVLEYTPGGGTWELAFSPASRYAGWGAANLHGLWAQAAPAVPGTLQFSSATYNVNETGASVAITVTRTGGNTGAVSVHYATADGTARQPAKYTAASGTLNWADGDSTDKTFAVSIIDEAQIEGNETVQLALSAPGGGASLGLAAATLSIVDDDLPANTPVVLPSAAGLSFGNQTVSTTSPSHTLSITNNGNATLNISNVSIGGTNQGDFALAADTCTAASVAPAATCTLGVTFTPTATGARSASLAIASNDPGSPLNVSLDGTGVTAVQPDPGSTAIPTLGEWALLGLSGLIGVLGLTCLRHPSARREWVKPT